MKGTDDIRQLLGQTPVPSVVEGQHREQLKEQLLQQIQISQRKKKNMSTWSLIMSMRIAKATAACLVATILVATGWGAEKVYQKLTGKCVVIERILVDEWTLPDGNKMYGMGIVGTIAASDDPKAVEDAKQQHEEVKNLIVQKEYELVKTVESGTGPKLYIYAFTLPSGDKINTNFTLPLENVSSWEEYLKKDEQQRKERLKEINKAISKGKFRLIDLDVLRLHVCREVDSNKILRVLRIILRDGNEMALAITDPADESKGYSQTSWQDHLQAIRNGKRELIDLDTIKNYTYEITLGDGSTTIFSHNGNPLKKSKE